MKDGERKRSASTEKSVRLTISLPVEDYRHLAAEAGAMRVSLAWMIRRAVSSYLDRTSALVSRSGTRGKGPKQ